MADKRPWPFPTTAHHPEPTDRGEAKPTHDGAAIEHDLAREQMDADRDATQAVDRASGVRGERR